MALKLHLQCIELKSHFGRGPEYYVGFERTLGNTFEVVHLYYFIFLSHCDYIDIHLALTYLDSFCLWFLCYIILLYAPLIG